MDTSRKIEMTVTLDVTVPQALALQAMFDHWNSLSSMGSSRVVSFYVDGDGNFHTHAKCKFSEEIPELDNHLRDLAELAGEGLIDTAGSPVASFDYNSIAWTLGKGYGEKPYEFMDR